MPSFYDNVAEQPRADALAAYLGFLEGRNGTVDPTVAYPDREAWLEGADASAVRYAGEVDPAAFSAGFTGEGRLTEDRALAALLSFVKANAGEAYGVEVLSKKRHKAALGDGLFERVERVITKEETYHTRILLGATRQFGLAPPSAAFRPPLALKVVIGGLTYAPKSLFHPILLGSEIAGVFMFAWMLERVGEVFRDQPALRESMEARLLEILVDEIGHIAFNRVAVGPKGLKVAGVLAAQIARASADINREFRALGWTAQTAAKVASFDYAQLPEEARRRAFFV